MSAYAVLRYWRVSGKKHHGCSASMDCSNVICAYRKYTHRCAEDL
jgi:hypothetical protein